MATPTPREKRRHRKKTEASLEGGVGTREASLAMKANVKWRFPDFTLLDSRDAVARWIGRVRFLLSADPYRVKDADQIRQKSSDGSRTLRRVTVACVVFAAQATGRADAAFVVGRRRRGSSRSYSRCNAA